MAHSVISVERLSKAYRIGLKEEIPDTFVGAMTGWLKAPLRNFQRLRRLDTFGESQRTNGKFRRSFGTSKTLCNGKQETENGQKAPGFELSTLNAQRSTEDDIIWALRDVSFEINEGEVVGIIGRNGAGKSTLLKILSRITEPTSGRAVIRGRVSSLLEVGTGFHPELTGRENVYMNGTILGMTKREIDRKFDEIVDFSGVERFLDTPVKRYSSGMQVRLAFAVAAHLEPEILIVDEVLAVGDVEFQRKCIGKMQSVARGGRTVLFVSHNMAAVRKLCQRGIIFDNGRLVHDVDSQSAVTQYHRGVSAQADNRLPLRCGDVALLEFDTYDGEGRSSHAFTFSERIRVRLAVQLDAPLANVHILLVLWRASDELRVSSFTTRELPIGCLPCGVTAIEFDIDSCRLFPADYFWSIKILTSQKTYLCCHRVAPLTIEAEILPGAPTPYVTAHGVVHLATKIRVRQDSSDTFFDLQELLPAAQTGIV